MSKMNDWLVQYITEPYFSKFEGICLSCCGVILGMNISIKNIIAILLVMSATALVVTTVNHLKRKADGK